MQATLITLDVAFCASKGYTKTFAGLAKGVLQNAVGIHEELQWITPEYAKFLYIWIKREIEVQFLLTLTTLAPFLETAEESLCSCSILLLKSVTHCSTVSPGGIVYFIQV